MSGTSGGSNSISASQRQPISMACFIAVRADIEWKMPAVFFAPSLRAHLLHHPFEIAAELRVMMVRRHHRDVLPMIAKIEYQHVEFG